MARPNKNTNRSQHSRGIGSNKSLADAHDGLIKFSYKYACLNHAKFSIRNKKCEYFLKLIERLRDLCTNRKVELCGDRGKSLRFHPIDWVDTTEDNFDISNEEQLVDTPMQFSISSHAHGRVHGFFIKDTFYIVWFDPDHQLYE